MRVLRPKIVISISLPFLVFFHGVHAQGISNEENRVASDSDTFATFQIAPKSVLSEAVAPLIEIARKTEARDLQGNVVENALNFNLGMQITPVKGLNVSGGVWRQEIDQRAQTLFKQALRQICRAFI